MNYNTSISMIKDAIIPQKLFHTFSTIFVEGNFVNEYFFILKKFMQYMIFSTSNQILHKKNLSVTNTSINTLYFALFLYILSNNP